MRLLISVFVIFILIVSAVFVFIDYGPLWSFPILRYRHIGEAGESFPDYVSTRSFTSQMKRIAEGGFKVIGLEEVVEIYRKSGKFPSHTLSITFDGGYADFYEHAVPVLAKYKFPVTVFLQSSNINQNGYMTKKQIRDLAERGGIKFGSNGQTGRSFARLNNFEASNEIFSSRTSLQRDLELPIDFLSYPDGDVNEFLIGKAEESGYKGACVLVPREKLPNRHPYILKRIKMTHKEDNPIFFRLKTWGNFVFLEQWRNRWKK